MCRSVQAAHTYVQVGTGSKHVCAGLYRRHTLRDDNAINKRHSLLIKRSGDKQAECVLLHINGWATLVGKWLSMMMMMMMMVIANTTGDEKNL